MLRINGGTIYDPANGINGEVRDLYVGGGKIVSSVMGGCNIDATGLVIFPAGADVHTHVAGDIRETPDGSECLVKPSFDPGTDEFRRTLFEDRNCMSFENYPVEMERIERAEVQQCIKTE